MISKNKKFYYIGQIVGATTALNTALDGKYCVILRLAPGKNETLQDISKCICWAADTITNKDSKLYIKREDNGYNVGFCDTSNQINFILEGYIEVKPATYEELWPDPLGNITED